MGFVLARCCCFTFAVFETGGASRSGGEAVRTVDAHVGEDAGLVRADVTLDALRFSIDHHSHLTASANTCQCNGSIGSGHANHTALSIGTAKRQDDVIEQSTRMCEWDLCSRLHSSLELAPTPRVVKPGLHPRQ